MIWSDYDRSLDGGGPILPRSTCANGDGRPRVPRSPFCALCLPDSPRSVPGREGTPVDVAAALAMVGTLERLITADPREREV